MSYLSASGPLPPFPSVPFISSAASDHGVLQESLKEVPGLSSSPSSFTSSGAPSCPRESADYKRLPIDHFIHDPAETQLAKTSGGLYEPFLTQVEGDRARPGQLGSRERKDIPASNNTFLHRLDEVEGHQHASGRVDAHPWTSAAHWDTGVPSSKNSFVRPEFSERALTSGSAASNKPSSSRVPSTTCQMPSPRKDSPVREASSSPRLGLGRLLEEEVASDGRGLRDKDDAAIFPSAGTQRSLRNRSISSAAALQNFGHHASRGDGSFDAYGGAPSIWATGRDHSRGFTMHGPTSFSDASSSPLAHSLASMPYGNPFTPSNEAFRPSRGRGLGQDAVLNAQGHEQDSNVLISSVLDGRNADKSGSESRRHSVTGSAPVAGQRRAIGFEINRPSNASRTASVGRSMPTHSLAAAGLFSTGDSAITDDDLTADFDALRINLDEVARQQQVNSGARNSMKRASSSNTYLTGAHAASMPPSFPGFRTNSSPRSAIREWPLSARLPEEASDEIWGPGSDQAHHAAGASSASRTLFDADSRSTSTFARDPVSALAYPGTHSSRGAYESAQYFPPQRFAGGFDNARGSTDLRAQPLPSTPSMSSLSDVAFASLATLGPMPPSVGPAGLESNAGTGSGVLTAGLQDLGKGVPLQMLSRDTALYIVEFKQGRTDLYFCQTQPGMPAAVTDDVRKGDLVIVEADRGKDLGTVINDSITVDQVQTFLAHQADLTTRAVGDVAQAGAATGTASARLTRSINPKRLFSKASPADTTLLHAKAQDEERALALCSTKVNQRGLPMSVVAAELQWDRRKLTFYYTATQRVDFRDLVKELFRLYKTRIWMCHLSHPSGGGGAGIH